MQPLSNNSLSLSRFISSRLNLTLLIITILWSGVSIYSYYFALDDASEFYLIEDAENALFLKQEGLRHDLLNSTFKQIYLKIDELPTEIQNTVKANMAIVNQTIFIPTTSKDIYVLPYSSTQGEPEVYVVHSFDKNDSINIAPYYLFFGFLAFTALALVIKWVVGCIDQQTKLLSVKISQLTQKTIKNKSPLLFYDHKYAFEHIKQHYLTEKKAILREKEFASYLSHELRQPLAKMTNSLSLIDQIDDLPYCSLAVINDMKSTNKELCKLTNMVLQLWQDSTNDKIEIDLLQLLKDIIQRFDSSRIRLNSPKTERPVKVFVNLELVNLMLKQLLQNSMQYANKNVLVTYTDNQIIISNDVRENASLLINEELKTHGYGIGLVIVDKICSLLDWQRENKMDNGLYVVIIYFK